MKLIQIKGCSGSGKTTIVKHLLLSADIYYICVDDSIIATVNPSIGWAAVGRYDDRKMGGCDTLSTVQSIKDAIEIVINHGLDEGLIGIVFEGMMISTIKTTFYDFMLLMEYEYEVIPLMVLLDTSLEGCIRRLRNRGSKKVKYTRLEANWRLTMKHADYYRPEYVRVIDVERTKLDDMLPTFLELVDDIDRPRRL